MMCPIADVSHCSGASQNDRDRGRKEAQPAYLHPVPGTHPLPPSACADVPAGHRVVGHPPAAFDSGGGRHSSPGEVETESSGPTDDRATQPGSDEPTRGNPPLGDGPAGLGPLLIGGNFTPGRNEPSREIFITSCPTVQILQYHETDLLKLFPIPTAGSGPWGIALGHDGNLWFSEYNANQIGRITPDGTVTEYSIPSGTAHAAWIAPGLDGNVTRRVPTSMKNKT